MLDLPALPDGLEQKDYWMVRTTAMEWQYVLRKLSLTKDLKDNDLHNIVLTILYDNEPIYLFKKASFTAAEIGSALGLTPERVRSSKTITLKGPDNTGLPKPTVDYWGTA